MRNHLLPYASHLSLYNPCFDLWPSQSDATLPSLRSLRLQGVSKDVVTSLAAFVRQQPRLIAVIVCDEAEWMRRAFRDTLHDLLRDVAAPRGRLEFHV